MSSPYPNLSPEDERLFDPPGKIDEKDQRIFKLEGREIGLSISVTKLKASNDTLCAMMEEAIAIFDRYLNVPESVALRKRWESFKNQTL
jgi:hypothetical protein